MKKYFVYRIYYGDNGNGFTQTHQLLSPAYSGDERMPGIELTYRGFDTPELAEDWINTYGKKSTDYTILPVYNKS